MNRSMQASRFPCPCCRFLTLEEEPPGTFLICPVCFWEDDTVQFRDQDCPGGANNVSLRQARQNFKEFGVSERRFQSNVRPPREEEFH